MNNCPRLVRSELAKRDREHVHYHLVQVHTNIWSYFPLPGCFLDCVSYTWKSGSVEIMRLVGILGGGGGEEGDGREGDGREGDGREGDGRERDGREGDGREGDGREGEDEGWRVMVVLGRQAYSRVALGKG